MPTASTSTTAAELRAANWQRMQEVIAAENAVLRGLVGLFASRTPFAQWPDRMKSALLDSLRYTGSDDIEREKAEHLRRHLFPDAPVPVADTLPCEARLVERVRSDLVALVPFGAGLHVVDAGEALRP